MQKLCLYFSPISDIITFACKNAEIYWNINFTRCICAGRCPGGIPCTASAAEEKPRRFYLNVSRIHEAAS
ncbi:MAG TPA: hypothetical protein DEP27_06130 [Ruminococcaceae bacterium]|nr:hypothetical protein [Oscillospiraceae bacterium]